MAATSIPDWNGKSVNVIRSKGGVLALYDFTDNLIKVSPSGCPPPEVLQKLYKSEKLWAFPEEDQSLVCEKLGYYCDLQSVHSEDAMQWSYFGPLIYGTEADRLQFGRWLRRVLNLGVPEPSNCYITMRRRLPHPDNGTPNGPEVDLLIAADTFVLVVESKWRSGEGRWQGMDGTATQVQLRQRYLSRFGKRLFGEAFLAVLYIVLDPSQSASGDLESKVPVLNARWTDLCDYGGHPRAEETRRYYDWKRHLVVRKFGIPAPG